MKNKTISVISALDLAETKAWALNTIKMAQAFARAEQGSKVYLICRASKKNCVSPEQFLQRYGAATPNLKLVLLPYCAGNVYLFGVLSAVVAAFKKPQFVYARNFIGPVCTAAIGIPTAIESHAHPGNTTRPFKLFVWAIQKLPALKLWVTISEVLKNHYTHELGVPRHKVAVLADAVDDHLFNPSKNTAATPFNYPKKPAVVYAGHLYDYKGIPTIIKAATLTKDVHFYLVGGLPEDVLRWKHHCQQHGVSNVSVLGAVDHKDMPAYLWGADMLLLPPSANHPSAQWTSPMKLGEYLLSKRPVLCSDIPALRAWVNDAEVTFFAADDAEELSAGIKHNLNNPQALLKAETAGFAKGQSLSFANRVKTIKKALEA